MTSGRAFSITHECKEVLELQGAGGGGGRGAGSTPVLSVWDPPSSEELFRFRGAFPGRRGRAGPGLGVIPAGKGAGQRSHRTEPCCRQCLGRTPSSGRRRRLPLCYTRGGGRVWFMSADTAAMKGSIGWALHLRALSLRATEPGAGSGSPGGRGCPRGPAERGPAGNSSGARQHRDLGLIHRTTLSAVITELRACLCFPSCPHSVSGLKSTRVPWASAIHIYMGGKEGWDAFKNYSVQREWLVFACLSDLRGLSGFSWRNFMEIKSLLEWSIQLLKLQPSFVSCMNALLNSLVGMQKATLN